MLTLFNHGFDQLDGHRLYQLLKLRADVFVVEQQCAYLDLDDNDNLPSTRHVYLAEEAGDADKRSGKIVACARCLAPGVTFTEGSAIGRVAVDEANRGSGHARVIMKEAIATCSQQWPAMPVFVSAQAYLVDFYQELGFEPLGECYLEDGISHQTMILKI